jgi:phenylacetate-coenzyme A ligase PaaK-like adenylate-forming protein
MEHFDELVTDRRLRLDELLAHLGQIDGDALYLGEYRAMTTSGSSGLKAVFVYDRAGWTSVLTMFLRRSSWIGLRPRLPRTRLALIGGGAPTHMSRRGAQSLDVGLHRLLSLSVTQPLDELVSELNAFKPDFVNVYPSTAGVLADERLSGRLHLRLQALTTSSEPLTAALRERLEHAFGVRPSDFYATTEGLWGHDCEHGSTHLSTTCASSRTSTTTLALCHLARSARACW